MTSRLGLRLAGVLICTALISNCHSPDTLGDDEAKSLVDQLFNQPDVGLLLGKVSFVAENPEIAKRQDKIKEWPLYKAFAKRGLIIIRNERDLTKNFGGWGDWLNLTQNGIRKTAVIELGESAKDKGTVSHINGVDEIWVKVATTKVESIVANDEDRIGTDRYRVVQGTQTYDVPTELSAAFEAVRNWDHIRERRFKVLLKYDPFEKKWKSLAVDIGHRTEDFQSDNVARTLQALKFGIH